VEGPPLRERQAFAQPGEVQLLDPLETEVDHPLPRTFLDGQGEPQVARADLFDLRRPDLGPGVTLEGVVAAEVLDVVVEHVLHQAAATPAQQAAPGGRHARGEVFVGDLLIAREVDLLQGVLRARIDPQDEVQDALGGALLGVDPDAVVALLLVVGAEAVDRLEHQRLVVTRLAQEREQPLAAQGFLFRADHLQVDPGADLDGESELDGVGLPIVVRPGAVHPRRPVFLADQPVLQALGVEARELRAIGGIGLKTDLAQEGRGRKRAEIAVEGERPHGGAGAAVDGVGHHGPLAPDRYTYTRGGLEIAPLLVGVQQVVDALHHPLLGERLGLALGNGPSQRVEPQPQVALDADRFDLHDRPEDDHGHHPAVRFVAPGVELDLGGDPGRLQVPQGAANGVVGDRLADFDDDQGLQVLEAFEGGVAANLDRGDDRPRRFGGRVFELRRQGPGGEGQRQCEAPCGATERTPQNRRSHCASTA
jgi:hypothetical protein